MKYDDDEEICHLRDMVRSIMSRTDGFEQKYLFGSRARRKGNKYSDYDFCVYPDDDVSILGQLV